MNVMNLFRPSGAAPTATPPANGGQPQPQANNQQPGNNGQPQNGQQGPGTPPGNNGQKPGPQEEPNPMDAYNKMWDNHDKEGDVAPSFNIDPAVMDKVVGGQDFMKGVNPELMQKALAGDAQSMMDLMQAVGRNAYRASIEHGGMLTDKFVGARESYSAGKLGGKVREELTTHELSNTPNFQHPVVKKQLTDTAKQLSKLHPDAAPAEIAKMAKDFLTQLSSAIAPTKTATDGATGGTKETNWDNYFDQQESAN